MKNAAKETSSLSSDRQEAKDTYENILKRRSKGEAVYEDLVATRRAL